MPVFKVKIAILNCKLRSTVALKESLSTVILTVLGVSYVVIVVYR